METSLCCKFSSMLFSLQKFIFRWENKKVRSTKLRTEKRKLLAATQVLAIHTNAKIEPAFLPKDKNTHSCKWLLWTCVARLLYHAFTKIAIAYEIGQIWGLRIKKCPPEQSTARSVLWGTEWKAPFLIYSLQSHRKKQNAHPLHHIGDRRFWLSYRDFAKPF